MKTAVSRALVALFLVAVLPAVALGEQAPAAKPKDGAPSGKAKAAAAAPVAKPKAEPVAPEPEYVGIPARVNPQDKTLQSLERQTYALVSKTKGLGFGGSRASYEVPGPTSPVRFPAGEPMTFLVRMTSKDVDPSSAMKLVPLQAASASKKEAKAGSAGSRQAVWMDKKGLFGNVNVDPTMGALAILAKPYGESSIQFKPESDLAPGEYAILLPASMTAYCFGVDSAAAK